MKYKQPFVDFHRFLKKTFVKSDEDFNNFIEEAAIQRWK